MKKNYVAKLRWIIKSLRDVEYDGTYYKDVEDAFKVMPMNSIVWKVWVLEL